MEEKLKPIKARKAWALCWLNDRNQPIIYGVKSTDNLPLEIYKSKKNALDHGQFAIPVLITPIKKPYARRKM